MTQATNRHRSTVQRIAEQALLRDVRIGAAESLSAGALSSALGAGPDAATWYRGAVVAYAPEVKFRLLDVTPGPVATATCAAEMARGTVRLLEVELSVAITGVGGPGDDEGVPAGTVFIACADRAGETMGRTHHFNGDPAAVVESSVVAALGLVLECLAGEGDAGAPLLAVWRDCHRNEPDCPDRHARNR